MELDLADVAWDLDMAFLQDPTKLPWEVIPADIPPHQRSEAIYIMLDIGLERNDFNAQWLATAIRQCDGCVGTNLVDRLFRRIFENAESKNHLILYQQLEGPHPNVARLKLRGETDPFYLGEVISNRYKVEGRVAAGGVAVVYVARDLLRNLPVILKASQLSPDTDLRAKQASCITREFDLRKRLNLLPGVPRAIELLELPHSSIIVEELILALYRRGIPSDFSQFAKLSALARVAFIADGIHRAGIIHGDITNANILVDDTSRIFLTDFNVSRPISSFHQSTTWWPGTRATMCPETHNALSWEMDISQDIYALGCLLYEILTGEMLLKSMLQVETHPRLKDRRRWPKFGRDVPRALREICRMAIAKHPSSRFATAYDFGTALQEFIRIGRCKMRQCTEEMNAFRLGYTLLRYGYLGYETVSGARDLQGLAATEDVAHARDITSYLAEGIEVLAKPWGLSTAPRFEPAESGPTLESAPRDVSSVYSRFSEWCRQYLDRIRGSMSDVEPVTRNYFDLGCKLHIPFSSDDGHGELYQTARFLRIPEAILSMITSQRFVCPEEAAEGIMSWLRWGRFPPANDLPEENGFWERYKERLANVNGTEEIVERRWRTRQ